MASFRTASGLSFAPRSIQTLRSSDEGDEEHRARDIMLATSERLCDDLHMITSQVSASQFQISDMASVQRDLANVFHACHVN